MYIQYNLSDGDIVTIQAATTAPVSESALEAAGRGQYEVADDFNTLNQINIKTGESVEE